MNQDICNKSAREVISLLRNAELTPEDVLDSIEQRVEAVDSKVNALPTRCFERAREHAVRLGRLPPAQRGPLAGLPVTIKDLTSVKGVRTTFGSRLFADFIPDVSDQLVSRLEQQGGIVYAKTNTPEFGLGGISFNDLFPPTRTPHNLKMASGGSSGGAAASLASGTAWLSHGSDMAGSLRTPASFCGVTSLRPSPGTISSDSPFTPYAFLGAQGPMARTIEDLALFGDVIKDTPDNAMSIAAGKPVKPARIAFSRDLGITQVDDKICTVLQQLTERLAGQGIAVFETHPDLDGSHDVFDTLRAHELAISLEQALVDNPGIMKPEAEWNIRAGLALDAPTIRDAVRNQGRIINRSRAFMQEFDLLICPACSVVCVPHDARYPDHHDVPYPEYYRWLAIAYGITVTSLPIITMPIAKDRDTGMPIAVQLIGQHGSDARLFGFARWLESEVDWDSTPVL